MRFALSILVLFCLSTIALPRAAAQDQVELFGGYSFIHASAPVTTTFLCPAMTCPITTSTYHRNLNGFDFSGTYKPRSWLGLTGEFGGQFGSVGSSSAHLQTYLFGPTFSFPASVSPFVHVLVGGAHESIGSGSPGSGLITLPTSGNAFAVALGLGIDINVLPSVSIRPIEFDDLATRFNSSTQNQPRVSAGVIFHF